MKPEWGTKRICPSCDARFYDLKRAPCVCPKCQITIDLNAASKSKRPKPAPVTVAPAPPAVVEAISDEVAAAADPVSEEAEIEAVKEDGAPAAVVSDDDEENDVMEDVSDLGKDEDDMAEVIEHLEDRESER